MSAAYATPEDVAAAWRPLSTNEQVITETFIEWASARLRKRVPNLDTRILAVEDDLELLARATTVTIVRRALINPEGWREVSIDDFRRVRDSAVSSGALYVSADDVADLLPTTALYGIYSIPLGGPDVFE